MECIICPLSSTSVQKTALRCRWNIVYVFGEQLKVKWKADPYLENRYFSVISGSIYFTECSSCLLMIAGMIVSFPRSCKDLKEVPWSTKKNPADPHWANCRYKDSLGERPRGLYKQAVATMVPRRNVIQQGE